MDLTLLAIVVFMHYTLSSLFHIKHFIADFPLQNEYMLGKFKPGWDFIGPLAAHVAVHGIITFGILVLFAGWVDFQSVVILTVLDMCIHFLMDRIKASPKMLGRFEALTKRDFVEHQTNIKNLMNFETQTVATIYRAEAKWNERKKSNKYFWWSLGLDQMVHGLTHELIVCLTILIFIMGL